MNEAALPTTYRPFKELILCSNRLVDVPIPLMISNTPVLLIGQGPLPVIWLSAPTEPSGKTWDYIIREGKSGHRSVAVTVDDSGTRVEVSVAGTPVLSVLAESDVKATVNHLDLRPLGLAVTGSATGLTIGTMQLSNNGFSNVRVAFAFG